MAKFLSKLKYYLQLLDGVWSVPLAFFIFWFIGVLFQSIFGRGAMTYDPGFIQPLFLAAAVVIGATNIAVFGLYFTFRGIYKYLYGKEKEDGSIKNYSKLDWLNLTVWQRFKISFSLFFFFVLAVLIVFLKLV